jgi:hypothetical protein
MIVPQALSFIFSLNFDVLTPLFSNHRLNFTLMPRQSYAQVLYVAAQVLQVVA